MPQVSASTLARIKATAAKYLGNDTCTIEKRVDIKDAMGHREPSWTVVATGVVCRLVKAGSQNTSSVEVMSNRESMIERYKLALLPDQEINEGYRVTIDSVVYSVETLETELTDTVFRHVTITRRRG